MNKMKIRKIQCDITVDVEDKTFFRIYTVRGPIWMEKTGKFSSKDVDNETFIDLENSLKDLGFLLTVGARDMDSKMDMAIDQVLETRDKEIRECLQAAISSALRISISDSFIRLNQWEGYHGRIGMIVLCALSFAGLNNCLMRELESFIAGNNISPMIEQYGPIVEKKLEAFNQR